MHDARCGRNHEVKYHSKQAYASLAFSQVRFQPYTEHKPGQPQKGTSYFTIKVFESMLNFYFFIFVKRTYIYVLHFERNELFDFKFDHRY